MYSNATVQGVEMPVSSKRINNVFMTINQSVVYYGLR